MNPYFVYMLSNHKRNVLYTGFTDDVLRRVEEHRSAVYPKAFTTRYKCFYLMWFEEHQTMEEALHKEFQIKRWRRAWKEDLINAINPNWDDLYLGLKKGDWILDGSSATGPDSRPGT